MSKFFKTNFIIKIFKYSFIFSMEVDNKLDMIYYPSQLILKIHYTFLYFLYSLLIFNRLKYYKENYKRINYYCIIIVKHRVRKNSSL